MLSPPVAAVVVSAGRVVLDNYFDYTIVFYLSIQTERCIDTGKQEILPLPPMTTAVAGEGRMGTR